MRKVKFLRYYYAKLTLVSLLSVVFLTLATALAALTYLQSARADSVLQEHGAALQELEKEFIDIWNDYYKAFVPLTDSYNEADLYAFCRAEDVGYDRYTVRRNFRRILADICKQDRRIKGLYFRRFLDDARFLYMDDAQELREVSFGLGEEDGQERFQRVLIGGMTLQAQLDKAGEKGMEIYGIQSGVQSVMGTGKAYDYQITVLYDLDIFDQILQKYGTEASARFCIASAEGMVLYDSFGEYEIDQEVFSKDAREILREGDRSFHASASYQKGVRRLSRGGAIAYYLIPQSVLVQLNGTTRLVALFALGITVVVSVALISVNRLANRKFQELEWGMRQIGKNNLGYRLPLGRHEDEFFRIAVRFNKMCDELEDMINKNYVYQLLQQNAEYEALQASVNPHFLYNSLEAIREMLDTGGDEAEMVLLLSRIFEYQIRGESIVTVQKEMDALRSYIDFASIRFRYSFEYSIDFDVEILDCVLPKQIFQPIAENYFAHGMRGDGRDYIDIRGYLDAADGMIHVRFCDNGRGLTREQAAALTDSLEEGGDNSHIGLRNVHQRLKLAFGGKSRVEIASNAPDSGACISLVLGQTLKLNIPH